MTLDEARRILRGEGTDHFASEERRAEALGVVLAGIDAVDELHSPIPSDGDSSPICDACAS